MYLKIESLNPHDRYVNYPNCHHYTTKFWYSHLNDIMNYLNVKEFNVNDFTLVEDVCDNDNYSFLYPIKDFKFKASGLYYDFYSSPDIKLSIGLDNVKCGGFNIISHGTQNMSLFLESEYFNTKYHQLFRYSHENIKIENLSIDSNRILVVSGDSHTVPLIPILCCYFKKVIVLDNRWKNIPAHLFYQDENITDVLIMLSYNNSLDKFIINNFY